MVFTGYGTVKLFVDILVPGIDSAITYHLKVFFGDVTDKTFDEFQDGDSLFNISIILMTIIMESYVFTIIFVDT